MLFFKSAQVDCIEAVVEASVFAFCLSWLGVEFAQDSTRDVLPEGYL